MLKKFVCYGVDGLQNTLDQINEMREECDIQIVTMTCESATFVILAEVNDYEEQLEEEQPDVE